MSNTWDPTQQRITFGKVPTGNYRVRAIGTVAEGSYPLVPAGVAPPVGPFKQRTSALFLREAGDVKTEKIHVTSSLDYGVGNMVWPKKASTGTWVLQDCIAENVVANPPGSPDGTAEAGFWLGQRTQAARLEARNCYWMGLWTGAACSGSTIEDLLIQQCPRIGIYCEHTTEFTTFRRFEIMTEQNGINIEWWYGGAGSHDLTFEDGDVYCPAGFYGVFADAGTYGCVFRRIRFWGPGNAIGLPNNRVVPSLGNLVQDCVFENEGTKITYHNNAIGA